MLFSLILILSFIGCFFVALVWEEHKSFRKVSHAYYREREYRHVYEARTGQKLTQEFIDDSAVPHPDKHMSYIGCALGWAAGCFILIALILILKEI